MLPDIIQLLHQATGKPLLDVTKITSQIATETDPWLFFKGASAHQIQQRGFTPRQATQLHAAIAIGKHAALTKPPHLVISAPAIASSFFMPMIGTARTEQFAVLVLDIKHQLLARVIVSIGTADECYAIGRDVFHAVISYAGTRCIVAHNHPSGQVEPSLHDLDVTRTLIASGQVLNIEVLDHLIVANGKFHSIRTSNEELWEEENVRDAESVAERIYDQHGYDKDGYDKDGYDKDGYDSKGFNNRGCDRNGEHWSIVNQNVVDMDDYPEN